MPPKTPQKKKDITQRYYQRHRKQIIARIKETTKHIKYYLGVGVCPKCGCKAYIELHKKIYLPTGKEFGYGLYYCHQPKWKRANENRPKVKDCWMPMTEAEYAEKVKNLKELKVETPLKASLRELSLIEGRLVNLQTYKQKVEARVRELTQEEIGEYTLEETL